MHENRYHPQAIVESEHVGPGTTVWAFAHVMAGAVVGANCNIGGGCFIEDGAVLGDEVTLKNDVMVWKGTSLGNRVFVGPNVTFTNDKYPRSRRRSQSSPPADDTWLMPIFVKDGASIGAAAIVLPGVSLGENCMVAAGALVSRDVPAFALVAGVPARQRGWVCICGKPLQFVEAEARCFHCLLSYTLRDGCPCPRPAPGEPPACLEPEAV